MRKCGGFGIESGIRDNDGVMDAFNFTKMHGLGNDYVYVNAFEETISDAAAVARAVSDRHLGIGGDGLGGSTTLLRFRGS